MTGVYKMTTSTFDLFRSDGRFIGSASHSVSVDGPIFRPSVEGVLIVDSLNPMALHTKMKQEMFFSV